MTAITNAVAIIPPLSMHLAIILACLGGCAIITSLWPLVTVSIAVTLLYRWVIRREERHLTETFGEQYRDYQGQVGRWFTL